MIIWMMCFRVNQMAKESEECGTIRSNVKKVAVNTNGTNYNSCCQYGDCPCSSLDRALNCSSNKDEVIIFIHSGVIPLSTVPVISNVSNFTMTSDGTSISCTGGGGLIFSNVRNIIINKITWKYCGNSPGVISVYNSVLLIKDSNFQSFFTRALALFHSSAYINSDESLSMFSNNKGGALHIDNSNLTFDGSFKFSKNSAIFGGAIYFTNGSSFGLTNGTQILFANNKASRYGGAIYADLMIPCDVQQFEIKSVINCSVTFTDNVGILAGKSWYFALNTSCNLTRNISNPNSLLYYPSSFKYTNSEFSNEISSTLYQLKLLPPAKCSSNISNYITYDVCSDYEISDIMLGQEIIVPAQALGYYGYIAGPTQVLINLVDVSSSYLLTGNNIVLIHTNTLVNGIKILSNVSTISNTTLQLTAIEDETISLKLIVQLSSCFPGFESVNINGYLHCKCYQHDIIQCTNDSTALIKFGYWFGIVKNQSTVAYCPEQYCVYASCNVNSFDYCKLPRIQDSQCRNDRTGPACGQCKLGYVIPFDSTKCVNVNKCSVGIMFLLIWLNVVYWFFIMIFGLLIISQYDIGWFYGIIYFYSIIEYLYTSTDDWQVFELLTILSNFAKLTPRFLGSFCITSDTGWNGIDQQFFHYVHFFVIYVLIICLRIICLRRCSFSIWQCLKCLGLLKCLRLFRCSPSFRCSLLFRVNKNMQRFICCFYLLSYTSFASTSLQLLLPLTFQDVEGAYAYNSPDLKYFHGRQLAYGIAAIFVVFMIIIFPVFLLLEPLLSRKVNFIRMRPFLDAFQGCYILKYRQFAGFYLVCRFAILAAFYGVNSHYVRSFVMQSLCTAFAIFHGYFMPYKSMFLNILDLFILIIAIFVASFNTTKSVTSFHSADSFIIILIVTTPLILASTTGVMRKYRSYKSKMSVHLPLIEQPKSIHVSSDHREDVNENDYSFR